MHNLARMGLFAVLFLTVVSCQPKADPLVNQEELMTHIEYLASEELGGRYPGTVGDSMASDYIREQYKSYGLELIGENGYQRIDIVTEVDLGSNNKVAWGTKEYIVEEDFMPLSFTGNGEVKSVVSFAGYGITIDKPTFSFDDYSDLDVKGKIVILLEGGPKVEEGEDDPFLGFLSQRNKILNAKDHGAVGVILVAGPIFDDKDELKFVKKKEAPSEIPVIRLKRNVADELLKGSEETVEQLELKHSEGETGGFVLSETVSLQTDVVSNEVQTQNILGYLENPNNPDGDIIVIGAHYDHLGMGGIGSSSRVPDTVAVHYGADDNASGVAALIEMAGSLSSKIDELPFSILFIAFAGEEMGLVGSKYYAENPILPIERVKAMFNMDMVGRLTDEHKLAVGGVGTAIEFAELLEEVNNGHFNLAISTEGYGPSDHAAFYAKDLPVMYFSTGAHIDYHTPADSFDKINGQGLVEIVEFIEGVIIGMGELETITYQDAGPKQQATARSRFKVTLGIMPDVTSNANDGLRVEFVTEGRPAQRSGMQKGDRIIGMNGLPVTNIYDYMTRLQTLEEGQTVTVEVVRKEEKIILLVQL